jgi:hypothetical protein
MKTGVQTACGVRSARTLTVNTAAEFYNYAKKGYILHSGALVNGNYTDEIST